MGLWTLRNMVRSLSETLLRTVGRAVRLRLLESLGRSRGELLRGRHRRVQPVTGLSRVLHTIGLEGLILVLRHEHVPDSMLCRNVIVKLLVEHDGSGVQMGIQTLVLCR